MRPTEPSSPDSPVSLFDSRRRFLLAAAASIAALAAYPSGAAAQFFGLGAKGKKGGAGGGGGSARVQVFTYSQAALGQVFGTVTGVLPTKPAYRLHRNAAGDFAYLVGEATAEAIVYAGAASVRNPIESDVLDLWRNDKGVVCGQLILKEGKRVLLIGENEFPRGNRYDLDRTGQYLVVSYGANSKISAVARAYRELYTIALDVQRLFPRRRQLMAVGGNPATGRLEARLLSLEAGTVREEAPIELAGMPAGVRVFDYNEATDDLLLGGVDAGGQTTFVLLNLTTGAQTPAPPQRPGDDAALFIANTALRAKLRGEGLEPAANAGPMPQRPAPVRKPSAPAGGGGGFSAPAPPASGTPVPMR